MGRKEEGPAEHGCFEGKRPAWPLLVGLALITLFVAVSCNGATGKQRAEGPVEDEQASADKSHVETDESQAGADLEHPSLGDENAPVVMIEHGDFQ